MIYRGHIRASKSTFQIFLWLTILWQIDILVQFCTLVFISSWIWKGRKWVRRSKILSGLNLNMVWWDPVQKQENFYWRVTGALLCVKNIKVPFEIGHPPHLHIKPSLYVCRSSRVIVILPIWVSSAQGGGAGVWGVSRVISYSLYEFRNVQR